MQMSWAMEPFEAISYGDPTLLSETGSNGDDLSLGGECGRALIRRILATENPDLFSDIAENIVASGRYGAIEHGFFGVFGGMVNVLALPEDKVMAARTPLHNEHRQL